MELNIPKVKDKMIMCRFDPLVFKEIARLAKQNNTSHGKVIQSLVNKALKK